MVVPKSFGEIWPWSLTLRAKIHGSSQICAPLEHNFILVIRLQYFYRGLHLYRLHYIHEIRTPTAFALYRTAPAFVDNYNTVKNNCALQQVVEEIRFPKYPTSCWLINLIWTSFRLRLLNTSSWVHNFTFPFFRSFLPLPSIGSVQFSNF